MQSATFLEQVTSLTRKPGDDQRDDKIELVRSKIIESAKPVEKIIVEMALTTLSEFPQMVFGVRTGLKFNSNNSQKKKDLKFSNSADEDTLCRVLDMEYKREASRNAELQEAGLLPSLSDRFDMTIHAVAQKLPGIVIHNEKQYRTWDRAKVTVLTPEGIFTCPYTLCVYEGLSKPLPDWEMRDPNPARWLRWAEDAVEKIWYIAEFGNSD